MIIDLSFPHGEAVNDGVDEALSSLTYVGVQEGVRSMAAKVDIKSAYQNVPVHPEDR